MAEASHGSGTLSAAIGLTVALTMLLGTVQLVARLHRTSVVGALATDAVHRVAEAPSPGPARREAETRIRAVLGSGADIRWAEGPDGPTIEIAVPSPRLPGLSEEIRRGARARAERGP